MPFDPVSESLWGAILKKARDEDKEDIASGYWAKCPFCGRRVVKNELMKKGCYVCAGRPKMENENNG